MSFTTGYTGNQFKLKPDVLFCFFNNLVIGRIIFPMQSSTAVEKTGMFYGQAAGPSKYCQTFLLPNENYFTLYNIA